MSEVKIDKKMSGAGEIHLCTIINDHGGKVVLSQLGAKVISVFVTDKDGNIAEVAVADDRTGISVFDDCIWDAFVVGDDAVRFDCVSPAESDDKDGSLKVSVEYRWTQDNVLEIYFTAESASKRKINFSNRAFYNLDGIGTGDIMSQYLWLNASRCMPLGTDGSTTGDFASVKETVNDFTTAKPIGRDGSLKDCAGNGGMCYLLDNFVSEVMNEVALLASHSTGRELHIFSTAPAADVYLYDQCTDKHADNPTAGNAIAINCVGSTDGADMQSIVINPGEKYTQLIFLEFKSNF